MKSGTKAVVWASCLQMTDSLPFYGCWSLSCHPLFSFLSVFPQEKNSSSKLFLFPWVTGSTGINYFNREGAEFYACFSWLSFCALYTHKSLEQIFLFTLEFSLALLSWVVLPSVKHAAAIIRKRDASAICSAVIFFLSVSGQSWTPCLLRIRWEEKSERAEGTIIISDRFYFSSSVPHG